MPKTTHGMSNTRTYRIWAGMVARCRRGGYGTGRVCERWKVFENFLADMGEVPDGLSLDRIEPSGDYEPSNVRLATQAQQCRNRKSNRLVTIGGVTKPAIDWARGAGLPLSTFFNRIYYGFPEDRLLEPTMRERAKTLTVNDRTLTVKQWAEETGIDKNTIWKRLIMGWTPEQAVEPGNAVVRDRKVVVDRKKHGHYGTRTYRQWCSMLARCRHGFPSYEAVQVCERWASFENFLADVGEIPDGMTLDRIDNTKGYEPGNVRLLSPKGQARNRSSNRLITIKGETKTLAEWSEQIGATKACLQYRIAKGWPEERLLDPPAKNR